MEVCRAHGRTRQALCWQRTSRIPEYSFDSDADMSISSRRFDKPSSAIALHRRHFFGECTHAFSPLGAALLPTWPELEPPQTLLPWQRLTPGGRGVPCLAGTDHRGHPGPRCWNHQCRLPTCCLQPAATHGHTCMHTSGEWRKVHHWAMHLP